VSGFGFLSQSRKDAKGLSLNSETRSRGQKVVGELFFAPGGFISHYGVMRTLSERVAVLCPFSTVTFSSYSPGWYLSIGKALAY
jgi:hypothetical protein